MRRGVVIGVLGGALLFVGSGSARQVPVDVVAPKVAIFYYAWYGTPGRDGAWQHWGQGDYGPPGAIGSTYYPARGPYSSSDPKVVRSQMRQIAGAGIDTVVVSWWGPGSVEDGRLRPVAAAATEAGLDVALHVEPWLGRTPDEVVDAIEDLHGLAVRDVYVYDSTAEPDDEWREALKRIPDVRVFAQTTFPGKALRGGFDGLYTYDVLVNNGRAFGRMCKSARRLGLACAPSVGPGFDASRATGEARIVARRDGGRYDQMWREALRAHPDVVTITSYNEWHEGTQIEPARAYPGPYASYENAWGHKGPKAKRAYLDRTRYWVGRLRGSTQ